MPIKSFRGKIAGDLAGTGKMNGIDTITLHTNNGSIGYRIKKFEIMGDRPGGDTFELTCKIFSIPQTEATTNVDFSDNTLLGVAYISGAANSVNFPFSGGVIFDNMVFNQDIYVTAADINGNEPANYYIELEQIKLALDENTVATLKDIKNIEQSRR
tara:strand:+ start:190 stop:660 length:471 start_codon:yes stop_codon:yes gene_type:complete